MKEINSNEDKIAKSILEEFKMRFAANDTDKTKEDKLAAVDDVIYYIATQQVYNAALDDSEKSSYDLSNTIKETLLSKSEKQIYSLDNVDQINIQINLPDEQTTQLKKLLTAENANNIITFVQDETCKNALINILKNTALYNKIKESITITEKNEDTIQTKRIVKSAYALSDALNTINLSNKNTK